MSDITVFLIHYSDQTALYKAFMSLNSIRSRLRAVIVFQQGESTIRRVPDVNWSEKVRFLKIEDKKEEDILQDTISTLDTTYVLLLSSNGYLSTNMPPHSLQLAGNQSVLGTFKHNRDITIRLPLLVRTSFLKQQCLLTTSELPFKEALFPAWLSRMEGSTKRFKEGLVKQTRNNRSRNISERQKLIEKYQLEKSNTDHPSLSIIMSNYNMERYVQTAVSSCLLQNEQTEQLLIMDDGSTDDSRQRLERYCGNASVQLFSKENGGKARALNALLPHVTSDFILELDADDWLDPDAVSVIKKHLTKLPDDVAVLYGNLRKWKQLEEDVMFKGIAKGRPIKGRKNLLAYRFPLGPRVYRTSSLKRRGGFPVIDFADGRLYEDVSVLNRLIDHYRFQYQDFTVYNVREHKKSITKQNLDNWNAFLKSLN
ncbi:glycosyltransferase family 2 protein [Lentibacillus jeotgali]|uniref:glycosyltransferase family 2 protein n=1 Tax=Lentibacillus jeotgali TaxID=558169 RepID=UPI00026273B7|nr:glycosyltransferase family 2 protein [Lentibacillus jeotgali]